MERSRGSTGLGVILIAIGLVFLLGQATGLELGSFGWPFFVIVPGVVLLAYGLVEARRPAGGLAIPGMIVTTVGLLLLYQNATGHWESWAYAWALVAPTSVGVALMLLGALNANGRQLRGGTWTAGTGLVLFLAFAAFFEGVLHTSGRDFGVVGSIGFPIALITLGVLLLVARIMPERS